MPPHAVRYLLVLIATTIGTEGVFAQGHSLFHHHHRVRTGTAAIAYMPVMQTVMPAQVSYLPSAQMSFFPSNLSFVPSTNMSFVPSAQFMTQGNFGTSATPNFMISGSCQGGFGGATPNFMISGSPNFSVSGSCQGGFGGAGSGGFEGSALPVGEIIGGIKLLRELFLNLRGGGGDGGDGGGGADQSTVLSRLSRVEARLKVIEKQLKIPTSGGGRSTQIPGSPDFKGASVSNDPENSAINSSFARIQQFSERINQNQEVLVQLAEEMRRECLRAELELNEARRSVQQASNAQRQELDNQVKMLEGVRASLIKMGVRFESAPPELKKEIPGK